MTRLNRVMAPGPAVGRRRRPKADQSPTFPVVAGAPAGHVVPYVDCPVSTRATRLLSRHEKAIPSCLATFSRRLSSGATSALGHAGVVVVLMRVLIDLEDPNQCSLASAYRDWPPPAPGCGEEHARVAAIAPHLGNAQAPIGPGVARARPPTAVLSSSISLCHRHYVLLRDDSSVVLPCLVGRR